MYVCVCVCVCLCVCVCVCVSCIISGRRCLWCFGRTRGDQRASMTKSVKTELLDCTHSVCWVRHTHTHTTHTPHTCTHRLSYVELTGCSSWTVCSGSSSLFRADHHQSSTHRHWGDPRDPEHTIQRGLNNLLVTDWVCVCVCVCVCQLVVNIQYRK